LLEPQDRRLLLDCVQPPEGYSLDQAIGTTYSLDLYALLGVPVAAAFRDAMSEDGQADPLATLEALRRYADRIHLFCQAGEIHVPRGQQRLFAYLEDCVIPVVPPSEHGVFHPKCWLLRFVGSDDDVQYRFVCLSRNLTFDRSWDTALVLDGSLESKRVRDPDPRPLRRFVEALPGLAVRESERAQAAVDRMLGELERVRFECPPEVESLQFWPMGVRGTKPPEFQPEYRPLLVVSPFLSESWVARHADGRRAATLVSREDQLQALSGETCELFNELFTFSQNATPEEDFEAQGEDDVLLSGLHAKLFVMDDGWRARVWTGSANATEAAFHHNVEFLVELDGWKKNLGIKTLLEEGSGEAGFRDLLEYWEPPTEEVEETDAVGQRLDDRLWQARRALANADIGVSIETTDQEPPYVLRVGGEWPELGEGITGQAWPIGLEERQARTIDCGTLDFGAVTLEALTAFVAVELTAREQDESRKSRFVLRLPVDGLPADRGSRLLRSMLQDRREFMRLLMILLADDGIEAIMNAGIGQGAWSGDFRIAGGDDTPLLESLLKSLDRSPERLDQIKRLLDDLGETGDLDEMLPEGFLHVWESVWANR